MLGRNPRDWRSYVWLTGMADTGAIISLGDQYIVSLGAHGTHQILLMDRVATDPLTVEKVFACCALLTYTFDAPVVPNGWPDGRSRLRPQNFAGFASAFAGDAAAWLQNYSETLVDTAAHCEFLYSPPRSRRSLKERVFPSYASPDWYYLSLPCLDRTWRALAAYMSGWLSVMVPGRVLNFWRATEAATSGVGNSAAREAERLRLFGDLPRLRVQPIWLEVDRRGRTTRRNSLTPLRREALRHWEWLVTAHASERAALDHLYWNRRGKAAHADTNAIEFDQVGTLGEQLRDAVLLRYLARIAIEQHWA
jgi:hypothetical protein